MMFAIVPISINNSTFVIELLLLPTHISEANKIFILYELNYDDYFNNVLYMIFNLYLKL